MIITIATDEEIFKPVTYPNIEKDRYLISNYGNLFDNKLNRLRKTTVHKQNGYVYVKLKKDCGKNKMMSLHRLVAWEFCEGFCENRIYVNHKDSCKDNNYYGNLEWCTLSENNTHRFLHGNGGVNPPVFRGENANGNIYKEDTIHSICKSLQEKKSMMEIMKENGFVKYKDSLSFYSLIYDIKRRKTWTCISNNYTW